MAATVRQWNMKSDIMCSLFVFAEPQSVRLLLELVFSCDSFLDAFFAKKGSYKRNLRPHNVLFGKGTWCNPIWSWHAWNSQSINISKTTVSWLKMLFVHSPSRHLLIWLWKDGGLTLLATNSHSLKNPCWARIVFDSHYPQNLWVSFKISTLGILWHSAFPVGAIYVFCVVSWFTFYPLSFCLRGVHRIGYFFPAPAWQTWPQLFSVPPRNKTLCREGSSSHRIHVWYIYLHLLHLP